MFEFSHYPALKNIPKKQRFLEARLLLFLGSVPFLLLGLLGFSPLYAAKTSESSLDYLTRAITIDPKDSDAYFSRGYAYLLNGSYDKAIADFSKTIQLSPQEALNYYFRGKAKVFQGDNRGGIDDFTKALQLNPRHADSLFQRAQVKKRVGEGASSEEDLTRVIHLNPTLASAYAFRGMLKSEKQDAAGALSDFKRAVALDPYDSRSFEEMAWIHLASENPALRNLELAKQCAEQAYQLEKKDEYRHTLACVLSDIGDFKSAENLENAIAGKDPIYLQFSEAFRKQISFGQFSKMEKERMDAEKQRQLREQERRNRIWEEIVEKNEKVRRKEGDKKQNALPLQTPVPANPGSR